MKSMIRWAATLGLAGSAVIGSSVIGNMRVLALPQEQIVQKLGPVPVFTITDNKGAPLVAAVPNQPKQSGIAGVFISRQDAQAFVEQLKKKDPNLAKMYGWYLYLWEKFTSWIKRTKTIPTR